MYANLRDEMRAKYGSRPEAPMATDVPVETVEPERAFVLTAETGRTIITAPLREVASANVGYMNLRGRFVEADTPNRNGALWTTEDLQLGQPTVAGGPLNWLHQERKIIGSLRDSALVAGKEAAAAGVGNHIVTDAVLWQFLFPNEAAAVERAAGESRLFYSMECISREVMCVETASRPGCGESFAYGDYDAGRCCSHLRERSSVRRFVDPLFLGGAIIVPPVEPGWANADVEVVREAAEVAERASLEDTLEKADAQHLVEQILLWANGVSR